MPFPYCLRSGSLSIGPDALATNRTGAGNVNNTDAVSKVDLARTFVLSHWKDLLVRLLVRPPHFHRLAASVRAAENSRMMDPAYLRPARFIESDAPAIVDFARSQAGGARSPIGVAVRLYYAVRDTVLYDPYQAFARPETYSGRVALERGRGFCVAKAALLAACARVLQIPARLGFADVRNHLATPRLIEMNGGDVFRWHAYTDLWLDDKFVKATPAFNLSMC